MSWNYKHTYGTSSQQNVAKAATVPDAPSDTVSCLCFSSNNAYMAASSWDSTLRVWQLNNWKAEPKFYTTTDQVPILRCCFDAYDTCVYFGTTDGNIFSVPIEAQSSSLSFGSSTTTTAATTGGSKFGLSTSTAGTKNSFGTTAQKTDPNLRTCKSVTPQCIAQYYKTLGLITGLKWHSRLNSLVVATSVVDPEKGVNHALIFYFDPTQTSQTMDTLKNQLILYQPNLKIINIDLYDDILCVCGIQSNPEAASQTLPFLATFNLATSPVQQNLIPISINDNTHIGQQMTSIAATKKGFIVANTLGDVEIQDTNQFGNAEYYIFNLFRVASGPQKCGLFPANCVSFNPSKDLAIICSGVNTLISPSTFQIAYISTISGYQVIKNMSNNSPVTACAFSNNDEFFVFATGNDWSRGVPKPNQSNQISIYLQKIPEDVLTELSKIENQQ